MKIAVDARCRSWALSWGACFFFVLLLHHSALFTGFWADDLGFAAHPPHSLADWLNFWNPSRGWFYRPVYLSWWAVLQTLGLAHPVVMHALGLALHASIAWLWGAFVFRLSHRLSLASVAAFVFVLWPGKYEAVLWVASHSTLLAAFFLLASLHAWLSWLRHERFGWYFLALLSFWFGCCSKNEAIVGAALFPLLSLWYGQGTWRGRFAALVPLVALAALFFALEWHAAHVYAAHDHNYNGAAVPLMQRLSFVMWFLGRCLKYILPLRPVSPLTLVVVLLADAIRRVMKAGFPKQTPDVKRALWFALAFWLFSSVPVPFASGLIALGERFVYIPALGLSFLVAVVSWATALVLAQHRRVGAESALSTAALALALLLLRLLWPINLPMLDFEVSTVLVVLLGACCWIAFRCKFLDRRIALTLFVVVGIQQFWMYLPLDISLWLLPFCACVALGCLWKRDWSVGMLLVFALWQNPLFAAVLLAVRSLVQGITSFRVTTQTVGRDEVQSQLKIV